MRIAICDDERIFRNILKKHLNEYAENHGLTFVFYEYSDGSELLSCDFEFNLIFMDYQMNEINGLDTVAALRKRSNKTKVIFISSFSDIVFDSLKVQTFRFLVKPLVKDKLFEALNEFLVEDEKEEYILVKDEINYRTRRIAESDILYIEADNVYSRVRTLYGFYKFSGILSELEKALKSDYFYRTHRSFVVSFKYISNYQESEIIFENGEKAALTKTKYAKFQKAYIQFLKQKTIGDGL